MIRKSFLSIKEDSEYIYVIAIMQIKFLSKTSLTSYISSSPSRWARQRGSKKIELYKNYIRII